MNGIILVATLAVLVCAVRADRGPGGGRGPGGQGGRGGQRGRGFPGGLGGAWGPSGESCKCSERSCKNNTSTTPVTHGCLGTNMYFTCTGTTCAEANCTAGEVWNVTQNQCATCQPGFQLSKNSQECVCNQGTTFSHSSASFSGGPGPLGTKGGPETPFSEPTCGPCPTGANVTQYSCECFSTEVLNPTTNACQDCPTDSTIEGRTCKCTENTLFYSLNANACQKCPGTLQTFTYGSATKQVCNCSATSQIFNEITVTCDSCPEGTTFKNNQCQCKIARQYYNPTTKTCQCPRFQQLNAGSTECTFETSTTVASVD